jgi:hypothetical protein
VSGRTGPIAAVPSLPPGLNIEFTEFAFFSEPIGAATGVAVGRDNALVVLPAADWFVWDRVPPTARRDEPVVGEPALDPDGAAYRCHRFGRPGGRGARWVVRSDDAAA